MRTIMISPADRNFVQSMTAPSVLFQIERAMVPDPNLSVARLDLTSLDSNDRVIDGHLGVLDGIVAEVMDYGTIYDFYLKYSWAVGELNLTGRYGVQFKVTFDSGEIMLFPQMPAPVTIMPRAGSGTPVEATTSVLQEVRVPMAHTFVVGDIIYPTGPGTWALASSANFSTLGSAVVTRVEDAFAFWYSGPGAVLVFSTDQGWNVGGSMYLDPDNDGKVTQAEPTFSTHPGSWVQNLGSADDTRVWSFQHYPAWRV